MLLNATAVTRFWGRVRKTAGCWIWRHRAPGGYATFATNGRGSCHPAHRVSWFIAYGEIPIGVCVLHRCDNPRCIRPDHLFLGTPQDNSDDKVAKGRYRHASKLTARDVREIRRSDDPQDVLAARYGVNASNISQVQRGHSWKHLPGARTERRLPYATKLTLIDVHAIRESTEPPKQLATRFGLTRNHVYKIRNGHRWKRTG